VAIDPNLAAMFPDPIEVYVEELAMSEELPTVAIGACLVRQHEAGALLRRLVTRASDDGIATDSQAAQLFRALHILGGARDAAAFPLLLRFLQGPQGEVDYLLGDASTETLPKIAAGVFDGNADALFEVILNRNLDGAIRGSLLSAAAFLTWDKRIDSPRMVAFLERFADEPSTPSDDLVWGAWAEAIALLGLRHLEPLVSEAEKNERLDELLFVREEFEAILTTAEQAPDDKTRFDDVNLGYIEDVLVALELFPYGYDDEADDSRNFDAAPAPPPVTNPWRHVGRNDPCPCGSGKKAKRCCLAA
jgi:uncharacterized protein DUF1186/SEC-C motif-containing protein